MRSHRFARVGLTAVGFALAAAALAGCGGGSSGTPTTQKKPVEPPTILSPRKGDVMGYTFDVAGTYVNSGTTVTVTVSGKVSGTGTDTSDPGWSMSFGTATQDNGESASATVPGSDPSTVDFTVKGSRDLVANLSTIVEEVDTNPVTYSVTVSVTNTAAGAPTLFQAALYAGGEGTAATHGPANLTQVMGTNEWRHTFTGVAKKPHGVQFKRTIAGTTVTTSRWDDVK